VTIHIASKKTNENTHTLNVGPIDFSCFSATDIAWGLRSKEQTTCWLRSGFDRCLDHCVAVRAWSSPEFRPSDAAYVTWFSRSLVPSTTPPTESRWPICFSTRCQAASAYDDPGSIRGCSELGQQGCHGRRSGPCIPELETRLRSESSRTESWRRRGREVAL
jgi:hypothetical protein